MLSIWDWYKLYLWSKEENFKVRNYKIKLLSLIFETVRCVPVLESLPSAPVSGERVAPSSLYDHNDGDIDMTNDDHSSSLSSLEASITDERTEIILAATFLLIVVLSFMAWVHLLQVVMVIFYIEE